MEYYAGIDVSLEWSRVCVVDAAGGMVREGKAPSEPEGLIEYLRGLGLSVCRVGLEAGPLSQWLHAGLVAAGFDAVLLETRHVKAALSAMIVKTDRKDARGIAQLLRMGWYRSVHCKSPPAQEVRALLTGRKLLLGKATDVELGIRGLLRGFGLKVGAVGKAGFAARVRELVAGHGLLEPVIEPMLRAREALRTEMSQLHRQVLALTYKSAVDDPGRFRSSKTVGAHFGLTPRRYQSGETDVTGGISRVGDGMVRTALYEAAQVMLSRSPKFSTLKRWALGVAKRRGRKRAIVALARKLACVLHRMWVDGADFRFGTAAIA
jgi:transposase